MNSPLAFEPSVLSWHGCHFDALTLLMLQNINRARQLVFVIEQQCIYLDADGHDESAFHLAAWSPGQSLPWAYARLLVPGQKYAEPSMGRVLTLGAARGTGLGRELVQRAIGHCSERFAGHGIRISAQTRLAAFYASEGFVAVARLTRKTESFTPRC